MLRNREFRQFTLVFIFIAAITIAVGFKIDPLAGALAICGAVAFGTAFFVFTKTRYTRIAQLSNQIDLVLHNTDHLDIETLDEGELAILQSEITKMTLRIREQNSALKKEKVLLANSLADIAHQLRTPLTSATLILSLLKNSRDENERKAFIREVEELLLQMDWLITSLLKLSRLDAGVVAFQREETDINHLLTTALRPLLIPMELHNIDVQVKGPKKVLIQGDSAWLCEAVQNILKNCMESTGDNGNIEIVVTDNPLFTEISIHDNGPGFHKEDLPRIFDRFYRGKNAGASGYGIGLALCKMIITKQGGAISLKNHPQGGAVFTIRFPK